MTQKTTQLDWSAVVTVSTTGATLLRLLPDTTVHRAMVSFGPLLTDFFVKCNGKLSTWL